ncbi:MAG: vWA domain-containing protein [Dehalococcoidales bacterium]
MANELRLECRLARDYAMVNVEDILSYLLIKIVPNTAAKLGSMPLNIGLVIDVSRSMAGRKLESAIAATKLLISALSDQDWISVTIFSDDVKVVIPAIQVTKKDVLLAAVSKIRTISGTRMFLGMEASAREINKAGLQNKVNRMILLTDGETEGEETCHIIAAQEKQNGVAIAAVGIGKRYNENLLSGIADATLGHFSHLKAPEQITDIFRKELGMAAASVIADVNMDFSLGEGVRVESLDRVYPNSVKLQPVSEENGRTLKVGLGNLTKDDPTIIGARLKLPAAPAGKCKITKIQLRYSTPSLGNTSGLESQEVSITYTNDQELFGQVDREVVSYFNQINAQTLVEEAIQQTRTGKIDEATKSLSQARNITEKLGNLLLTQDISEALDELEAKGLLSSENVKSIKAGSRRTVQIKKTDVK